jgi:outer membrane protein
MTRRQAIVCAAALVLAAAPTLAQAPPSDSPAAPTAAARRLTLAQAEDLARRNNPQISISRLNALASQQVFREVHSAVYPTLTAYLTAVAAHEGGRISAGSLSNPAIYDRAAGGVALNQLVTDFGRTSNLVESSKLRTQADDERAAATIDEIVLAVDQSFYNALEGQALHTVAEQTVSERQQVADRIHALAESKLRSELDARFADVDLAEAKLLLLDADNSRQGALAALAAVLGESDGGPIEVVEESASLSRPAPEVGPLIAEAMSRRPDLTALEFDARAAERFRLAEKDLELPSIRVLGAAGGAPYRNDAISPWYGAIGVNVEIPIFNGFLYGARAREAEYRAEASRQRLLELQNEVARDVKTSWLDAGAAYARLAVAAQLLEQANSALDLARSRYELGLSSIVELSQAQLQQTRAEIGNTEARYRYRVAESRLRYAIGGHAAAPPATP